MRLLALGALALLVTGCQQQVDERPYELDDYVECVRAFAPVGTGATMDANHHCLNRARESYGSKHVSRPAWEDYQGNE